MDNDHTRKKVDIQQFANPVVGRTGLCNMLFIWARAYAYCLQTGAKMLSPQWTNYMRLGPWFRGERDKRYYRNEFINAGYITGFRRWIVLLFAKKVKVFKGWYQEYFEGLLEYREEIRKELIRIVNPAIVEKIKEIPVASFIGVHIRRGDFKSGGIGIGNDWYVKAIRQAQKIVGDLPIYIFSDAPREELEEIKNAFHRSVIMPFAPAIQDVLTLAQGRVLVATSRSTFSMWAVFLGQMPSLWSTIEIPPVMYESITTQEIIDDILVYHLNSARREC